MLCPVGRFSVVLSSTEGRAYAVFCGTDYDRRSNKKTSDQPQALAPCYPVGYSGLGSRHFNAQQMGFHHRVRSPVCVSVNNPNGDSSTHTHTHTPALTKPAPPPPPPDTRTHACRAPNRAPTRQFKTEHLPALACVLVCVLAATQPAHPRPLRLTELVPIACLV